ncbi:MULTISPECIES: hypothetical protein [Bacteria]|uniref:hypothetical protein n=1 Tax=Bacteria TaxID=2 RepID=UPI00387F26B1
MQVLKDQVCAIGRSDERDLNDALKAYEWAAGLPAEMPLTPKLTSRFLQAMGAPLSEATLARIRCVSSTGPAYEKIGARITYRVGDLREYLSRAVKSA